MNGKSKDINFNEKIGKRIRQLRESRKIKRSEICSKLGFHENSVHNHESGHYSHSMFLVLTYCRFYGITPNQFLEGIEI